MGICTTSQYRVWIEKKLVLLGFFIMAFVSSAVADPVNLGNGFLSVSNGALFATEEYSNGNFSIAYDVVQDGAQVTYTYSLFAPLKSLGHWNFQVSSNFTASDLLSFTSSIPSTLSSTNPTTFNPGGSQEGMPKDLFGFKISPDTSATRTGLLVFTFVTDRLPTDGNFYARVGNGVYAFNTGFGDTNGAFILVPNGIAVVPEPGSLLLSATGIAFLGIALRRKTGRRKV